MNKISLSICDLLGLTVVWVGHRLVDRYPPFAAGLNGRSACPAAVGDFAFALLDVGCA
jgi:hypothetical protein